MAREIAVRTPGPKPERMQGFDGNDIGLVQGSYFVALDGFPERLETAETDGRWETARETTYRARRAVQAGTVLLAVRLRFLDDVLHTVEMAPHPEDPDRSSLVFMAEEFFTGFRHEPEGPAIREREIAALTSRITELGRSVAERPADPALPPPGTQEPSATDLVRSAGRQEDVARKALAITEIAEKRMLEVKEVADEIGRQTALVGNYYQERAQAALAAVNDQIEFAKGIMESVKTLSLYVGDGVEVRTLREGAGADPSIPLTLHQNRLFLDEELAVEALTGGFDFTGLDRLDDILAADPAIIDRMLPTQRSAVLVRVRRHGKDYGLGDRYVFIEAMMNVDNQRVFLLVRNGENVHMVHSEITTDAAERLFPTRREVEEAFRSFGRKVTPQHLDYAHAKDAFERMAVFYRRMLLMCWGLDDRLGLFGEFYDRNAYSGWYDERFQRERVQYVHDEEDAIGHVRPSFREWMDGRNALLQPGSRVAVQWAKAANYRSAPAMYGSRWSPGADSPERLLRPVSAFGIATVEREGQRLFVRCEAEGYAVTTGRKRTKTARIDLAHALDSWYSGSTASCLCLDGITVNDVDWYLNSRRERQSYLSFLELFRTARAFLAEEEEAQATAFLALEGDLSHAVVDPDLRKDVLSKAVELWRAAHDRRLIGGPDWCSSDARTVLDIAWALTGKGEKALAECGPGAMETRLDGEGNLWLYREPLPHEKQSFEEAYPAAFVVRTRLAFRNGKAVETGPATRTYLTRQEFNPRKVARGENTHRGTREETLERNAGVADLWDGRRLHGAIEYEALRKLHETAGKDALAALHSFSPDALRSRIANIYESLGRGQDIPRVVFTLPVAVAGVASKGSTSIGFGLVCLTGNALDVLAWMDNAGARSLVNAYYAEPGNRIAKIEKLAGDRAAGKIPALTPEFALGDLARKLVPGCNVFNSKDFDCLDIRQGRHGKAAMDAREALAGRFLLHVDDTDGDLVLAWPLESNRVLMEKFYAASK